jgi:putative SOS response-associated peptidase YedK
MASGISTSSNGASCRIFTKDLKKARKPINARSETAAATTGMFKAAFAERRCPVPATVYYEWRNEPDSSKTPFVVARVDGHPVAFADIWEDWHSPDGDVLLTFSTITTDASRQLAAMQDRMPVISSRPIGRCGSARPRVTSLPCSARWQKTCCACGYR